MSDTCHLCHATETLGRQVSTCRKCDRDLCSDCAEVDYDMVDDPPRYVCTQYQCPTNCERRVTERRVETVWVGHPGTTSDKRKYSNRGRVEAR